MLFKLTNWEHEAERADGVLWNTLHTETDSDSLGSHMPSVAHRECYALVVGFPRAYSPTWQALCLPVIMTYAGFQVTSRRSRNSHLPCSVSRKLLGT